MTILIKRYQNRKLYDTQSKHYVTLQWIEELIKNGEEIIVIDNLTGKDITSTTLSQVIFETRKNHTNILPIRLLTMIMQSGEQKLDDVRRNIITAINPTDLYNEEIERRIKLLMESGQLSSEDGNVILGKLLSVSVDQDFKEVINYRIEASLKRFHVLTKKDLQSLELIIDNISNQLTEFEAVSSKRT